MFTQFKKLSKFYDNTSKQNPSLIFRSNDFPQIKQEYLLELLKKNDHSLKPIELWDKIMDWAIAQPNNGLPLYITKWTDAHVTKFGTLIQPFISYIEFKEMSCADFNKKVKPFRNIFDDEFYIKILEHYSFSNIPTVETEETVAPPEFPRGLVPPLIQCRTKKHVPQNSLFNNKMTFEFKGGNELGA